jgi:uncharacterized membrane protein
MDPAFLDVISSCLTAIAVIAVLGALFIAVVDQSDSDRAKVPPSVMYLAALGIILFLLGRAIRELFG